MVVGVAPTVELSGIQSSLDDASMILARFDLCREPDDCLSSDEGFFLSICAGRGVFIPVDIVELKSGLGSG
jgi:hypothetical protein